MKLAVFTYDFLHKKSQDFLIRLFLARMNVAIVLSAPRAQLSIPEANLRVNPRYGALLHPGEICARFGWPYEVLSHNSPNCAALIRSFGVDLGIIAGARILNGVVLRAPKIGVLNMHPGLLPEIRGLDTLQWALLTGKTLGITAHLIDERIDRGRIILRRAIHIFPDDTLVDLSLRLHDVQVESLTEAIDRVTSHPTRIWPKAEKGTRYPKMAAQLEQALEMRLKARSCFHLLNEKR